MKAFVLLQGVAVLAITAAGGWGAVPMRDTAPPKMEQLGAPPDLIAAYSALDRTAFPVEDAKGRVVATAAYAATPAEWGGPGPLPPSVDILGESPLHTIEKLSAEAKDTVLFVVPASVLRTPSPRVRIREGDYALRAVAVRRRLQFAIASATVPNDLLSSLGGGLTWRDRPIAPRAVSSLLLTKMDPDRQAYALTRGAVEGGASSRSLARTVTGVAIGTPVIDAGPDLAALTGFVERSGQRSTPVVPSSAVIATLQEAAPSVPGGGG